MTQQNNNARSTYSEDKLPPFLVGGVAEVLVVLVVG
jgi:hypothetical protein